MSPEQIAKYLRFLAELIEKDATRANEIRNLTVAEMLDFAKAEAEKNVTDAEDLKNLGHENE